MNQPREQQRDPNKPAIEQPGQNEKPTPDDLTDERGGAEERRDGRISQPERTDIEREDKQPRQPNIGQE